MDTLTLEPLKLQCPRQGLYFCSLNLNAEIPKMSPWITVHFGYFWVKGLKKHGSCNNLYMKLMKQTLCFFVMCAEELMLVLFNQFCIWLQQKQTWAHSECTPWGNYTQVLFNEMFIQFRINSLFLYFDRQCSQYFRLAYACCLSRQCIYIEKSKLSCRLWCWKRCSYVALLSKFLPRQRYWSTKVSHCEAQSE